jgi:hypothetical protein
MAGGDVGTLVAAQSQSDGGAQGAQFAGRQYREIDIVLMIEADPYRAQAGCELDNLIHSRVMGRSSETTPPYSIDLDAAWCVLNRLKEMTHARVVVGRTALRNRPWFARYETDPSDGTEVFGETPALAICRLALLHTAKSKTR